MGLSLERGSKSLTAFPEKKVGIKRGFVGSSCTPGDWNCIHEGFYCPILDGILGVYKIMAGGRRKVLEPFLRGVGPSGVPGALERLWGCYGIRNAPSRILSHPGLFLGLIQVFLTLSHMPAAPGVSKPPSTPTSHSRRELRTTLLIPWESPHRPP